MINPTEEDIGRRVRWLSKNFGELKQFNDEWCFVRFDAFSGGELTPVTRDNLFWADDNLAVMQTSEVAEAKQERAAGL